ncbi:hypothetical protein HK096_000677, partial [Nowakowskiella sp. JEL0078]
MTITVTTLTGKMFSFDGDLADTIENIKNKIQICEGVPTTKQRLVFVGKKQNNSKAILNLTARKTPNFSWFAVFVNDTEEISAMRQQKLEVEFPNYLQVKSLDSCLSWQHLINVVGKCLKIISTSNTK